MSDVRIQIRFLACNVIGLCDPIRSLEEQLCIDLIHGSSVLIGCLS